MAYNPPPSGPPPYYGYPPPPSSAPGAFTYVPAPAITVAQPGPPPTFVTNFIYPPQPTPTPVQVVDHEPPVMEYIDWVPTTPGSANSLYGRAYEAGREGYDGSPLWIIRAHHNGDLIPGKLAIKHKAAYVPYCLKELPVHNIEVLCAPSNMVQWVPASYGEVPPNALIAGNTITAEPLYIGRVQHKRSVTPGKIHPSHKCCYISYGGYEVKYKHYEVLVRLDGR